MKILKPASRPPVGPEQSIKLDDLASMEFQPPPGAANTEAACRRRALIGLCTISGNIGEPDFPYDYLRNLCLAEALEASPGEYRDAMLQIAKEWTLSDFALLVGKFPRRNE